jgi:hypothetical protein
MWRTYNGGAAEAAETLQNQKDAMKINVETVSFLNDLPSLVGPWAQVTGDDCRQVIDTYLEMGISADEAAATFDAIDKLEGFVAAAASGAAQPDYWLSVHIDESGLIDKAFGPCVMANDNGQQVLVIGQTQYPIAIKGLSATVGELEGDIEVAEIDGVGDDGKPIKFLAASIDFELLSIPIILQKVGLTKAQFKTGLKAGQVGQYLKVAGAGNWVSMNELELGEYLVSGLVENPVHSEYGRSWTMTLEGIGEVRSKGKRFESILTMRAGVFMKLLANGRPLTLCVSSKEQLTQGMRVDAGFFMRAPNPEKMPVLASAAKSAALPAQAQPALKSAAPDDDDQEELEF